MSGPEQELQPLTDLVRRAARVDGDAGAGGELRRLQRAWRRKQQGRAVGLSLGLVAAAGSALLVLHFQGAPAPLAYGVEGDVALADHRVDVRGEAGARVSFSDGTRFSLERGTRARIAALDGRGARVQLEAGRARVAVVHRPRARWAVEAGPFTVHVVGTVFDVTWSRAEQVLEVALTEGEVKVEGPLPQLPLPVRAGQRLVVRVHDGQLRIAPIGTPVVGPAPSASLPATPAEPTPVRPLAAVTDERLRQPAVEQTLDQATRFPVRMLIKRPSAPSAPALAALPAAPPPQPTAPAELPPPVLPPPLPLAPSPPAPALPPVETRPPWAARLAAGQFQAVLDEAIADGLEQSYERRSSDELAGLGDAARYLGRNQVAKAALQAQRRRFPGSENAARAAFRLGVLAEASGDGLVDAIRWYDVYLGETPAGAYAAEALGRKMLALEKRDGAAAAHDLADAYRQRFPRGAYLVHALRILRAR